MIKQFQTNMKKIKTILLLTSLLASGITLYSQTSAQVFSYSRSGSIITLTKDNQIITFGDYTKDNGKKTREVKRGESIYHFVIAKGADGKKMQELSRADGTLLARVALSNLDITKPDGSKLTYKKKDGKHWAYLKDNHEVITGEYKKANGKKELIVIGNDLTAEDIELLQLICLERGTDSIVNKGKTGPIIIVAVVLAILRSATATPAG